MIDLIRFTWKLLVLSSLVLLAGIISIHEWHLPVSQPAFLTSLLVVTLISFVSFLVMNRGIRKKGQEGTLWLLVSIGMKFLLYLLYLLLFWLVTKNLTKPFIITFFALYLIFTFFLIFHLLKSLNYKQL